MRRFMQIFRMLLYKICILSFAVKIISAQSLIFLILDQPTDYHVTKGLVLAESLVDRCKALEITCKVYRSSADFSNIVGYWAFWPLISDLVSRVNVEKEIDWLFTCEDETAVDLDSLIKILSEYDSKKEWFLGHALYDLQPTIIHHYAFHGEMLSKFGYPDTGAGFAMTSPAVKRLIAKITSDTFSNPSFSIDSKHELAMLLWDDGKGLALTDRPEFCTYSRDDITCCTTYKPYDDDNVGSCQADIAVSRNLTVSVKTCQKFHKTRIVVLKRTWGKDVEDIEYFSDAEDHFIPTVQLGIANTERGHCAKTMGIIKRFLLKPDYKSRWLMIVDDDTLVSVNRLIQMLKCNRIDQSIILGERYGYGFSVNGQHGYDYPTGGSGIIFSPSAASQLAEHCNCPTLDSPDDMIIGMCARSLHIPVVHSPAMHQARPVDYSPDYLKRQPAITFHKHYEIDPYVVYKEYLEDKVTVVDSNVGLKDQNDRHDEL